MSIIYDRNRFQNRFRVQLVQDRSKQEPKHKQTKLLSKKTALQKNCWLNHHHHRGRRCTLFFFCSSSITSAPRSTITNACFQESPLVVRPRWRRRLTVPLRRSHGVPSKKLSCERNASAPSRFRSVTHRRSLSPCGSVSWRHSYTKALFASFGGWQLIGSNIFFQS